MLHAEKLGECRRQGHGYILGQIASGRTFDSAAKLLAWLSDEAHDRDVFFKDMMDHQHNEVLADRPFLAEARHAFLIRRPEEIAASYSEKLARYAAHHQPFYEHSMHNG